MPRDVFIDSILSEWKANANLEHPNVEKGIRIIESLRDVGFVHMVHGTSERVQSGHFGWTRPPTMVDLMAELGSIKNPGNLHVVSSRYGVVAQPPKNSRKEKTEVSVVVVCP